MPDSARHRNLIGCVLRPIVGQLALAGLLTMPFSNKLVTSIKSSHCTQSRLIMDFRSERGRKEVQDWYDHQGGNTRFTLLEYRKYKDGRLKHEFIAVRLDKKTICRFDRRPHAGEGGYSLRDGVAFAEDSAHVLFSSETEYTELMERTEVLLSIKLPHGEDLGVILAVCEGIQTHVKAATYSLMQYNCYFFSWMIMAAMARRACNWETIILSKAGWDGILQASFACVFSTSNQHAGEPKTTRPQRNGMKQWFGRVFTRRHSQAVSPDSASLLTTPSGIEILRDALLSAYSDSHNTIQRVPRTLLLRSQLGPALNKELSRIESSIFSSAKLTVALMKVRSGKNRMWQYFDGHLNVASRASAKILCTQDHPAAGSKSNYWKEVWRQAWDEAILPRRRIGNFVIVVSQEGMPNSAYIRDKTMEEWKNAWDEIDQLSVQYAAIITAIITRIMMEQLVFGGNFWDESVSKQPATPSLQEFIRERMHEHFEMVDRFGFGSSQELIASAEEAMYEVWVISLRIIESRGLRS
ncbi:unnamed protein product [Rhizoctonia solani]|uniref:Uncharacterized protein n=1 Tax=Rhizoctonia solani TaxID=456999 RepID=A0A8H3BHX7_9AGAM|nr:unnamed protein product [Rhizoctonia solani]